MVLEQVIYLSQGIIRLIIRVSKFAYTYIKMTAHQAATIQFNSNYLFGTYYTSIFC